MYQILKKQTLNANTKLMVIEAPHVARKAEPGQFIILRVSAEGERIPLTIADFDREKGSVTIIFQEVGATTMALGALNEGDCLHDFVGPLGKESELEGLKKVAVVGGGLGCAIAYPQAKKLHEMGAEVDLIAGFRNKDIIILEDEMKNACTNLHIVTDDGSAEALGFAIPSRRVKYVADTLIAGKTVRRGIFGFTVLTRPAQGSGLTLDSVDKASDAYAQGLRAGDVLIAANGQSLNAVEDLVRLKQSLGAGDAVSLTYVRDGQSYTASVALIDPDD